MNMYIFLLSCAGLVLILNKSTLLKPVREYISKKNQMHLSIKTANNIFKYIWFWIVYFLDKLFTCSLCMGFWSGALMYSWVNRGIDFDILPIALASAATSHLWVSLVQYLDRK